MGGMRWKGTCGWGERDARVHVDGGNEIQGYMWMGRMRWKDTCGWGK